MATPYVEAIRAIPQQPQTQGPLTDQLLALRVAANRLGLWDAADYLRRRLDEKTQTVAALQAELDASTDAQKLREGMVEIYRVANACRNDMQGRLIDDQHKRMFDVLGAIVNTSVLTLMSAVGADT